MTTYRVSFTVYSTSISYMFKLNVIERDSFLLSQFAGHAVLLQISLRGTAPVVHDTRPPVGSALNTVLAPQNTRGVTYFSLKAEHEKWMS